MNPASPLPPLDDWRPVLPSRELGNEPREIRLQDREIAFYRAADGIAHAIDNRCPHRRMRLALGKVDGDRLVCPYHGWNFGPDGVGRSPATPGLRVRTGHYEVVDQHGMLWLRSGGGVAAIPPPALHFAGYTHIASLHHRLAAPLGLLVDNMSELEHTASVHSIFGFEPHRMHEVKTHASKTADGLDIYYEGPQRKLPFYLRWATGIAQGDRFVQRAKVLDKPLHAVYDLAWFEPGSARPRPFALRFVIFFNEAGPDAGTQTTFVFAHMASVLTHAAMRCFSFVLRHHIDSELRADIALVEQLRLDPGMSPEGLPSRFDRPLSLRRRAAACEGAAACTTAWQPIALTPAPRRAPLNR